MTEPVRCAVLSAAHVHATSYLHALTELPQTELVAVWDDDGARGREAAEQHGVRFSSDLDGLLSRSDLEAVVITAENVRHRSLCEAACLKGKHVLCEKPLATTAQDAEAMVAAAQTAGVVLATAFPMRHNLPAIRVKEVLESGALGRILAVRATNHGTLPPGWFLDPALAGGGAVTDHTVHVADLLRWYLHEVPVEVYAEISHGLYGLPVEDSAYLTISFPSGVVATIDPSWSRPSASSPIWGDITMEIAGERGTLQLDAFNQKVVLNPAGSQKTEWIPWGNDADAAMIGDFACAVREGARPAADGRDGERALAIVLAAYRSAKSGQPAQVAAPAGDA